MTPTGSAPTILAAFGAGDAHPYEHALTDGDRVLHLHEYQSDRAPVRLDIERFRAEADAVDAAIVRTVFGPVIDIGCGPGRIVRAAIIAGHLALGIDVSLAAVQLAQDQGLPVLRRSIFGDLPAAGTWGAALLIDGNIGIGGDPRALLQRCAELVVDDGRVLVEAAADPLRDHVFEGVVVDDLERTSLPFPWAEVGVIALRRYAADAELRLVREWERAGRVFAEYVRA